MKTMQTDLSNIPASAQGNSREIETKTQQAMNLLKRVLYKLFASSSQPIIFFSIYIAFYCITPLIDYYFLSANPYMLQLAQIASLAALCMIIGYAVIPRYLIIKPLHLFKIKGSYFVGAVISFFVLFVCVLMLTAKNIPLYMAFKVRDPYKLSIARAEFLKARQGYEIIFLYIHTMITTSFLPYVIFLGFVRNYAGRWYIFSIPYLYSFIFLEKAFFLRFILPFMSLTVSKVKEGYYKKYFFPALLSIPLVVIFNTFVSGFGTASGTEGTHHKAPSIKSSSFYSANYQNANSGILQFITWRVGAVPVFSASDSLKLYKEKYHEHPLYGRTSTLVSHALGMNNIKFEREVFQAQWGGEETNTASSNAVFVIEQYVNFGWLGVLLSALLVGYIFAVLMRSKDLALAALSVTLALSLLFGGLMSTMVSCGFLALFSFLYLVKLE